MKRGRPILIVKGDDRVYHSPKDKKQAATVVGANGIQTRCGEYGGVFKYGPIFNGREPCPTCYPKGEAT